MLRKLEPFRLKNPPEYIKQERVVIPIPLRTGVEYHGVLDDVVGQLKDVADLLRGPAQWQTDPEGNG